MTIKPTIKWGIWGAMVCLAAYLLMVALERLFPDSNLIWSVYRAMICPLIIMWDWSGLLVHDAPRWNTWFVVTVFLFPVIVGFGIGALTRRMLVSR
jgi:hypothetical protein